MQLGRGLKCKVCVVAGFVLFNWVNWAVGHLCQANTAATFGKWNLHNVLIIFQNRICEYE